MEAMSLYFVVFLLGRSEEKLSASPIFIPAEVCSLGDFFPAWFASRMPWAFLRS